MTRVPGLSLGEEIGRGGMGVVHAATVQATGERVAVKLMRPSLAADPAYRDRFLREGRAAQAVRSEGVVRVREVGEADGELYLVMDLVTAGDLRTRLAEARPSVSEAAELVVQLCHAVQAIHDSGLVHGDLSPANVLVTEGGKPLVSDFGLAVADATTAPPPVRGGSGTTDWTASGPVAPGGSGRHASDSSGLGDWALSGPDPEQLLGSRVLLSPEQWRGERASSASDVYALGGLLVMVLTGRPPYEGHTLEALLHDHLLGSPPRPSQRVAGLDAAWDEVVARALAVDPAARWPSAAALAQAVSETAAGRSPRRHRRHRRHLLAALVALAAALVAGGTALALTRGSSNGAGDRATQPLNRVVCADNAGLRDRPRGQVRRQLAHGTHVLVLARDGAYAQGLLDDGSQGWLLATSLAASC